VGLTKWSRGARVAESDATASATVAEANTMVKQAAFDGARATRSRRWKPGGPLSFLFPAWLTVDSLTLLLTQRRTRNRVTDPGSS
jgi:hypothetical protein